MFVGLEYKLPIFKIYFWNKAVKEAHMSIIWWLSLCVQTLKQDCISTEYNFLCIAWLEKVSKKLDRSME